MCTYLTLKRNVTQGARNHFILLFSALRPVCTIPLWIAIFIWQRQPPPILAFIRAMWHNLPRRRFHYIFLMVSQLFFCLCLRKCWQNLIQIHGGQAGFVKLEMRVVLLAELIKK